MESKLLLVFIPVSIVLEFNSTLDSINQFPVSLQVFQTCCGIDVEKNTKIWMTISFVIKKPCVPMINLKKNLKMPNIIDFINRLSYKTSEDTIRDMIKLLSDATADYNLSFNAELSISSVLEKQIQEIVSKHGANINVAIEINGRMHTLLSVVLNNYFPAYPDSQKLAEWLLDHGASIEHTHPSALHKAILMRCWSLVVKLYILGLQPLDIQVHLFGALSPFKTALLMKQDKLAQLFVTSNFLTPTDISDCRSNALGELLLRYHVQVDVSSWKDIQLSPNSLLHITKQSILANIRLHNSELHRLPKPIRDELEWDSQDKYLSYFQQTEEDFTLADIIIVKLYKSVPYKIWRNPIL
nr:serine/threonine-protein phosphatase 6 regulatory ankyrin repeat subunit A-like [Biomphalaria glabrata]